MAVQTTSLPLVIDLLVQKFQGLNLTVDGAPVLVYDGPEGPAQNDNFVVVMADDSEPEAQTTLEWAALGSLARYEEYDVIVGVFCYMGGDANNGTFGDGNAQETARANAADIEAAIEAAMLADVNLATQNNGVAPIIWCLLAGTEYGQMDADDESGMGRFAYWRLRFHVYNRLHGLA